MPVSEERKIALVVAILNEAVKDMDIVLVLWEDFANKCRQTYTKE